MDAESLVPELIVVRVVSHDAPFEVGAYISVAYSTPTMGRLVPHGTTPVSNEYVRYEKVLPDAFSARVTSGSSSYRNGELLTFSFVDPRFARIHRSSENDEPTADNVEPSELETEARTATHTRDSHTESRAGVLVRMEWTAERARRFVQIVDKLFTVDRLGWYRHALAMRLLVPDTIECSDGEASTAAMTHLQMLRAAAIAALGRPLLAACMPAFAVSVEWLETVDSPDVARALAGLRREIAPHVCDAIPATTPVGDTSAVGWLLHRDFHGDAAASVDAFLATLVPHIAADPLLSERLRAYREALCDVFAQTARTTELVRLGRMSEPNTVLDDRLWQLACVVGKTLGGLAVA